MVIQITLGEVIGWIITIASAVGVVVTVKISIKNSSRKKTDERRITQKNIDTGGGHFIGGDQNGI